MTDGHCLIRRTGDTRALRNRCV